MLILADISLSLLPVCWEDFSLWESLVCILLLVCIYAYRDDAEVRTESTCKDLGMHPSGSPIRSKAERKGWVLFCGTVSPTTDTLKLPLPPSSLGLHATGLWRPRAHSFLRRGTLNSKSFTASNNQEVKNVSNSEKNAVISQPDLFDHHSTISPAPLQLVPGIISNYLSAIIYSKWQYWTSSPHHISLTLLILSSLKYFTDPMQELDRQGMSQEQHFVQCISFGVQLLALKVKRKIQIPSPNFPENSVNVWVFQINLYLVALKSKVQFEILGNWLTWNCFKRKKNLLLKDLSSHAI